MNFCPRSEQLFGANPEALGDSLTNLGNYAYFFGNILLWIIVSFPPNFVEMFMGNQYNFLSVLLVCPQIMSCGVVYYFLYVN